MIVWVDFDYVHVIRLADCLILSHTCAPNLLMKMFYAAAGHCLSLIQHTTIGKCNHQILIKIASERKQYQKATSVLYCIIPWTFLITFL